MIGCPASVIIVSRNRPEALCRCLTAVSQLLYHPFEVVVVADRASVDTAKGLDFAHRVTFKRFDKANISEARNLGLALAAGEVVAFIDDDAVPEPGWLHHLTQPIADDSAVAAGGFVRGSNGISFQHRAKWFDSFGYGHDIPVEGEAPLVLTGEGGQAINTQGTNCAFRRDVLARMGGFDPAYRYYLDETDLNMRLANLGAKTAIVPLAEVHHATAASDTRQSTRMPNTLHEIGASQMVYLRKFAPKERIEWAVEGFRIAHRKTLLKHMISGNCEPRHVKLLLATLAAGLDEGRRRPIRPLPAIGRAEKRFKSFNTEPTEPRHIVLAGFKIGASRLRRQASAAARDGNVVSLWVLSRTTRFHRVVFRDGYWEQSGGLFGKSDRADPLWRFTTVRDRVKIEWRRIALRRDPANAACGSGAFAKSDL